VHFSLTVEKKDETIGDLPCDMRRSFDGLRALVSAVTQ
jgi:hypothetical protein